MARVIALAVSAAERGLFSPRYARVGVVLRGYSSTENGVRLTRIGAQIRFLTVRQAAALAVAVVAIDAVVTGLAHAVARPDSRTETGLGLLPPETHILAVLVGLALISVVPRLLRGTATALSLAVAGLLVLAGLSAFRGHWMEMLIEASLGVLLLRGRRAFPLGCRNRPRRNAVMAAAGAWVLAYVALRVAPLAHAHPRLLPALHHAVIQARLGPYWLSVIELLMLSAALISVIAMRSALRPVPGEAGPAEHEYRAARAIIDRYGRDSLAPFILRPDKALQFAAGGVLSYQVIRGTAVVSSDPVAPDGAVPDVLAGFLPVARSRGWQVALWAASAEHLAAYRALGLRCICVGEEAFVDPARFTLEGRPVRKLRQSVNRVARRGWTIMVREGREIESALEIEIDQLERRWREAHPRLHGFAMGMGSFDGELRPDDLFALARSPDGQLGAVMRFASHCGRLSLDTMRRVGETPNGLNEALVCHILELARERGVAEVSLNYAGLAHLLRRQPSQTRFGRMARKLLVAPLHRHFQMDRLVRFNEKFSPTWRPRYLVYETQAALPRSVVRVLQAEGYLPQVRLLHRGDRAPSLPRALARPQAKSVS